MHSHSIGPDGARRSRLHILQRDTWSDAKAIGRPLDRSRGSRFLFNNELFDTVVIELGHIAYWLGTKPGEHRPSGPSSSDGIILPEYLAPRLFGFGDLSHVSIRCNDWHRLGNIANKLENEVLLPKLKRALFTIEAKGTQCKILSNLDWVIHGGGLWPLVRRLRDQCRIRVIWEITKCHSRFFTKGDEDFSPSDFYEFVEDHSWE